MLSMENAMKILVTTIQDKKIRQVLSITNNMVSNQFDISDEIILFRRKYCLQPVDECWVVGMDTEYDFEALDKIVCETNIKFKIFRCSGIKNFSSQESIKKFQSAVYRVVLNARETGKILYLSSEQGIAYGALLEAANIFGCDAMYFLNDGNPLLIKNKTEKSLISSCDDDKITARAYPLDISGKSGLKICDAGEDDSLLKEIEIRRNNSDHLYANYYGMIKSSRKEREVFRKLYYLTQEKIEKIKAYRLGKNKAKDLWIIRHLPKAELHSHIGGLLLPSEIIEVAKEVKDYQAAEGDEDSKRFYENISTILKYQNKPDEFERLIYGEYLNKNEFKSIGIDEYQRLGNFQGSGILQQKETIRATLEIYAKHLIQENVRYVEIRCSPYKYTRLGLSAEDVIETMIKTLDSFRYAFDYRLIYIIGRQASKEEIKSSIETYCKLYDKNPSFASRFVGVDLAGNEGATKPSEIREDFMPLLEKCAKVTIHAGETESVDSIWEAVYHLNADRIGHGLKLLDKQELFNRFLDKKIGVEMCPSSNDQIIGFESGGYPLKKYMEQGLRVTVNTDDCGISRTTLANEYLKAAELCSELTLWDCLVLIRNSLCIAFCDEDTKSKLMHSFEDEMLEFFNELF